MTSYERVADNVYSFQSDLYAQVNAGVVVGVDMAVVIDTLAYPEETMYIRDFVERELQLPVRYVINTHYHADHSWGNYLFPNAKIVASSMCYDLMKTRGIPSLERTKAENQTFRNVKLALPDVTFDSGEMVVQAGKKNLRLMSLPGCSPDNIGILIEEDRVLFAGDTVMPLPFLVDGDIEEMTNSLKAIPKMGLENIVQGHGDIVLRGEIDEMVKSNLEYLSEIRKVVRKASRRKYPLDLLEEVTVEECGKSRVLLNGLAEELHQQNMVALYKMLYDEVPQGSEEYFVGA